MAKTYRGILIFVVILGIVMGLAGKKFDGYVYTNTEPRSNTECTLTQRVFDDADVLTDEEEAKLEKLIAEKEKLIGGDIVLMTTNDASLNTMEKLRDYAQNYYKENKIGWDKPIGSGAIYVDDWETRHTWLATRGTVKDKLSKDNTDYFVFRVHLSFQTLSSENRHCLQSHRCRRSRYCCFRFLSLSL